MSHNGAVSNVPLSKQPTPLQALRDAGIEFQLHQHLPARNQGELHLTGLDLNASAKTLAFSLADGRIALVAIPGLARLRYPKLAATLGVPRSALRPASPQALSELGMTAGGVAPFAADPQVMLALDRSLLDLPRLYCGSGSAELTVELSPADLLKAMPQAVLADLRA